MELWELSIGTKFFFINEDTNIHWEVVAPSRETNDKERAVPIWNPNLGFCSSPADRPVQIIPDVEFEPYPDLRLLLGTKLRHKRAGSETIVTHVTVQDTGVTEAILGSGEALSAGFLLIHWEHFNGDPCGIPVDNKNQQE